MHHQPIEPGAVVVVTGISAAGKSTVADALARRFERGVHVRGDVFRRMVVAGRAEMRPEPSPEALAQLRLRYQLGVTVANRYAAAGFTTVLQDVVFGDLPWLVDMIDAPARYVVVLAPRPDVVARREAARDKTAYGKGRHSIADLHTALVEQTPRLGLWLDSSDLSVEQTVDAILDRAGEARVPPGRMTATGATAPRT